MIHIVVQIEPKPGTNRLVITGQLLDLSNSGVIGRDIPVTLSNHRGHSVVASTNQFGEFTGEVENSGDLARFAAHHWPFYERLYAQRLDVMPWEQAQSS